MSHDCRDLHPRRAGGAMAHQGEPELWGDMSAGGPGGGLLVQAECPGKLPAVRYGGGNTVSLGTRVDGEIHG